MNRPRNRVISLLLAASMILASAPANAHAAVIHKLDNLLKPSVTAGQWVNPQYEALLSAPTQHVLVREEAPIVTPDDVCYTLEDAAYELRQGMVDRMDSIAITFPDDADFAAPGDATNIWNEALKHTGNPKEGDYLLGQLRYYGFKFYYNVMDEQVYYTCVFTPGYLTTAEQEQQMDDAVDALLLELALDEATEYDKVKGIYDWICANVTYDHENLNDKNYYLKHSAYAAMINGKAVCQGYAVLFYRLALELGVDSRYITGTGNGGTHAWNIVRLGSLYYNLDATWDQPLLANNMAYKYFLRCGANFDDHVRDDSYNAAEFYQQYPMSPEDYGTDITWPVSGTCGENLTWVLDAKGTLNISGSGSMMDFYAEDPQWQQYAYHIRKVVIGPEVQSVGAFAFYYCANLKQVEVQGSTVLCESAFSYCVALEQVSMPNVLALHDGVFYGCNSLKEVHLPASLQNLGKEVFFDCIFMQKITVDPANPYYTAENNVLFNKEMTQLYVAASMMGQAYNVPEGVTQISPYAFRGNAQLQVITLPNSLTVLDEGVFYGCTSLKSVTLGNRVQQIGDFAFFGCTSLQQAHLPSGLLEIRDYAFGNTGLSEITIPASVTTIGNGAFEQSSVAKITFEGPAPQMGEDVFGNVFADVYYPSPDCDMTWENMTWDYGGFLQWYPTDSHCYHAVVTPPTCDLPGFTTYTCSCGSSYVADHRDPAGHSWDEGSITQNPTDTAPGKRTYTCIACGATREEEIPPTSHDHQYTTAVTPPTCTEKGYTTYTCSACGHSYTDHFVDELGHNLGQWEQTKAPACATPGEQTRRCATCGHEEKQSVEATGHSYSHAVTAPTCTVDGYTTHTCSACGHIYTDTVVTAPGHTLGQWEQTKAPACETAGEQSSRCSICGHVEIRPLDALQHSFSNYVSDGNATCLADGTKTALCDHGCGKKDTQTDPGSALGHDVGQWQVVVPATTETEGLQRRICSRCDYTEEQAIPVIVGPETITSDVFAISDGVIASIAANTSVAEFLKSINEADFVKVFREDQQVSADSLIATGMKVRLIVAEQTVKEWMVVVTGDINGDGNITLSDMLMVKSHVLGKTVLADHAALAADTNDDKGISITDFLQIKAHILGKNNVKPHG